MKNTKFIGENLRLIRLFHGLSLKELGQKVNVSTPYLSQVENNVRKPSQDLTAALAEALEVYPDVFSARSLQKKSVAEICGSIKKTISEI